MNGYEWQLINLHSGGSLYVCFSFYPTHHWHFSTRCSLWYNNCEISATKVTWKYRATWFKSERSARKSHKKCAYWKFKALYILQADLLPMWLLWCWILSTEFGYILPHQPVSHQGGKINSTQSFAHFSFVHFLTVAFNCLHWNCKKIAASIWI